MLPTEVAIPEFRKPAETVSPSVHNLLHDSVYVEGGIQYAAYKPLNACMFTLILLLYSTSSIPARVYVKVPLIVSSTVDPLELKKTSRSATFHYRDANAFIDTKRFFLDVTWFATKADGTALSIADNVSCLTPPSQQILESVVLNIGTSS